MSFFEIASKYIIKTLKLLPCTSNKIILSTIFINNKELPSHECFLDAHHLG
jgi:hypothetical protein